MWSASHDDIGNTHFFQIYLTIFFLVLASFEKSARQDAFFTAKGRRRACPLDISKTHGILSRGCQQVKSCMFNIHGAVIRCTVKSGTRSRDVARSKKLVRAWYPTYPKKVDQKHLLSVDWIAVFVSGKPEPPAEILPLRPAILQPTVVFSGEKMGRRRA